MSHRSWQLCLLLSVLLSSGLGSTKADDSPEWADFQALRLAIRDLSNTYPHRYTEGQAYLRRLEEYEKRLPQIREGLERHDAKAIGESRQILALKREALLANPLLDFDRLLLIRRKPLGDPRRAKADGKGLGKVLGLPQQSSWQLDTMPNTLGWENSVAALSPVRPEGRLSTIYRPASPRLVSDVELHFDARKLMFSMPDKDRLWQIFEIGLDDGKLRQISRGDQPEVHNFDSCYLPNGQIAFISTAALQGVPCNDAIVVGLTYVMDADGQNVRQLCFDQDHNYCPTVMNDGRILYLRWEYADLPHHWPRILFTMNPDGTGQREFYGSGSYWPNAIFYARPIPNHPTKVAGIITGHHVGRVGELIVFDPARGRQEADGVVQRIPGRGKPVEPLIMDKLTLESWPKFLHPYPLSEKYFIVSCKPTPDDLWGIYLVDVFDNLVLIKEEEGHCLLEPIPVRKREPPPVIPQKAEPGLADALVFLEDVYAGDGLKGVPRGAVKKLRLLTYHYAYPHLSGGQHRIGTDGPWEPKCVLGTVAVEEDGSAFFRVPANTPISIQPLDADGNALQLMRSWLTAMPGEIVSCVGCHEKQNTSPPSRGTIAARRRPSEIEPWYGPARGFSFKREVQPVLDEYCVGCHDGSRQADGAVVSDLRGDRDTFVVFQKQRNDPEVIAGGTKEELAEKYAGVFEPSYVELRRFVRVAGFESDLHLLPPGEFHGDTTELVQILKKGHYGVKLDQEAWDRLATWIDLNAPCHGTWGETLGWRVIDEHQDRRNRLRKLYAGGDDRLETVVDAGVKNATAINARPIVAKPLPEASLKSVDCPDWPLDAAEAGRRQAAAGTAVRRTVDLGGGVEMELVLIPAGQFVMGSADGPADERPQTRVTIEKPFWMGQFEVTNRQYARFDASHDSRHEHGTASFIGEGAIGPPLDGPHQPVVRVSWNQTMAFCDWVSSRIGEEVSLPTEAQWEYACRAGSAGAFSYGGEDDDFSPFANVADATLKQWAYFNETRRSADQVPRDERFNDEALVTVDVGRYRPNAWGLYDMHGNVSEWTRLTVKPYPYRADDGRNEPANQDRRVVRGGSWYDRPDRCRSAFRLSYPTWRRVYNVGFRVVVQTPEKGDAVALRPAGVGVEIQIPRNSQALPADDP